jgi:hypothetical protein
VPFGKKQEPVKIVDQDTVDMAVAKAVYLGDLVAFRLLLSPFSPARQQSTESFAMEKYRYLLPNDEVAAKWEFKECLEAVKKPETRRHIRAELEASRPTQLPSDLVLRLADQAVRLGKYSSAAQAYEQLRIRQRMQEEIFRQADEAMDRNDMPQAAKGYIIGTGLNYDYAAFPEPLPAVANFQTRALMLHGSYPERPEDSLPLLPVEQLLTIGLSYLLADPEIAARLDKRPLDTRLAFLVELVHQRDPEWQAFAERYREACAMAQEFAERYRGYWAQGQLTRATGDEIVDQIGYDPRRIMAHMLGRTLEGGEWWQYLKELAYEHPASVLFIARFALGDIEVLLPRLREGSSVIKALELMPDHAPGLIGIEE